MQQRSEEISQRLRGFTARPDQRDEEETGDITCRQKLTDPKESATEGRSAPCAAYLRGDPMREVGGVGLLPALCRRRTACRRNVLRSRRKTTVSSLPGAVVARHMVG